MPLAKGCIGKNKQQENGLEDLLISFRITFVRRSTIYTGFI